jgi:hypothetical protein
METTLENTVRSYLRTKASIEAATEELKGLEETIKNEMVNTGIDKVKVDNKVVSLVNSERRSFDADTLKSLIPASVFKKITEPAVRTQLFDAAVKLGTIKKDIEEQVVSKTPYSQLRIK